MKARPPGSIPFGFTLVEVIVALLLLEIFLLGALVSMRLGAYRAGRGLVLEHAIWEATALADSIAHHGADGATPRDRPWGWITLLDDRVEARDSSGRLLVGVEVWR